jgi:polysaccharide biosynthesis protein PslF
MSDVLSVLPSIQRLPRRFALLSTLPPEQCGLATFTAALASALVSGGCRVDLVRVVGRGAAVTSASGARATLVNGDPASIRAAAAVLSQADVAIVQHEYGIFGGPDGDEVLDLLKALEVPSIVVLHTVPLHPTVGQLDVLERVCDLSDRVVVMTHAGRDRLLSGYDVDGDKVHVIPHGAAAHARGVRHHGDVPQLLTWGLLGPGKGIELVIDALAILRTRGITPHYTVAGVTHPKVRALDGDAYRDSLIRRARNLGVADRISFDGTYRTPHDLARYVAGCSVVVLPYESRDQITSGVLVDAIAAGRPVIATAFPHAVELLASGAGIVVAHDDPTAMAAAIELLLGDADRHAAAAAEAQTLAPSLAWGSVAGAIRRLADDVIATGRRNPTVTA